MDAIVDFAGVEVKQGDSAMDLKLANSLVSKRFDLDEFQVKRMDESGFLYALNPDIEQVNDDDE